MIKVSVMYPNTPEARFDHETRVMRWHDFGSRLNNRPRETLNWMTPSEAWAAQLKSLNVVLGT